MGDWILAICCWLCALLFGGMGLYAYRKKTPMHFWSGSRVDSREIRDIPGYNRANARLWIVYGSLYVLLGALGLVHALLAAILLSVVALGGTPILILVYQRIYKKYKA